jgi:hypothetical protein
MVGIARWWLGLIAKDALVAVNRRRCGGVVVGGDYVRIQWRPGRFVIREAEEKMRYVAFLVGGLLLAAIQGGFEAEAGEPVPLVGISREGESGVKLTWTADEGRFYSVQYSDDLSTWWTMAMGNMDNWTDEVEEVTR